MSPEPLDAARFRERALPRLRLLYADRARAVLDDLLRRMDAHPRRPPHGSGARYSQADVVLITYADSIRRAGEAPLRTLARFLEEQLAGAVNTVHFLPFCPSSSDGGFSVIDYKAVAPAHGSWDDIARIGAQHDLMMDLVLNHCSSESAWFQAFVRGEGTGHDFFHTLPADTDVSQVVRPRTHPLLQPFETARGTQHVWATFSRDQPDLDYGNPAVLLAMVDVLLTYIERGARIVRLDAVAFLWKRLGTPCIHLDETHDVVKLMRDICDMVAPDVILLTETNVPNDENLSYFGAGDEAHMVYQFSLPPLLLHALYAGDASALTAWAASLRTPPPGCTFFNFTASHDGIGLRPVEGLLDERELERLVAGMQRNGGLVSFRAVDAGNQRPYELNVGLFDALRSSAKGRDRLQVQRFLAAQTAMIGLRGIPGVYIHSLTATPNDYEGYDKTKHPRDINRHRWDEAALLARLRQPRGYGARVFREHRRRLALRRWQAAFHPDASMEVLQLGPALFAFERLSLDGTQRILALHNVTPEEQRVPIAQRALSRLPRRSLDLLSGVDIDRSVTELLLEPYQCMWLAGAGS
ncbi:MAG: sugar phosphorylase [Sandaracinaceae bacterium]|nr:sugar phosphorylase [Sandaracinaceae bacterium]